MKSEELLLIGGIALALYLYSKNKGNGASLANVRQTSPLSNNPNTGIDIGKKVTDIGGSFGKVVNGAKEGYGAIKGIVSTIWNQNNNAMGNDSFDLLDQTGSQTGGWGTPEDVDAMTV